MLEYINSLRLPKLNDDERLVLDEPVVKEEIFEAIKALQSGKSLGTDGLPVNIYKCYMHKLTPVLLDAFNEAMQNGKLHQSARRGIVSLLEKVGRNPLYLKN